MLIILCVYRELIHTVMDDDESMATGLVGILSYHAHIYVVCRDIEALP